MKGNKGYSLYGLLAVLFVVIAFLPTIRRMFVRSFPEGILSRFFRKMMDHSRYEGK
jgi:hypothetical protein